MQWLREGAAKQEDDPKKMACLEACQAHGSQLAESRVLQRSCRLLAVLLQAPGLPAAQLFRLLPRHDAHHPAIM